MRKIKKNKKTLAVVNLNFIKKLNQVKKNKKNLKHEIKKAKIQQINTISELFFNFLMGNLPCSKYIKQKLKPHANDLRSIGNRKLSSVKRRHTLLKKGGNLLGILLPIAISAISSLMSKSK